MLSFRIIKIRVSWVFFSAHPPFHGYSNGIDQKVDVNSITVRGPLIQGPYIGPLPQGAPYGTVPYARASNGSSLNYPPSVHQMNGNGFGMTGQKRLSMDNAMTVGHAPQKFSDLNIQDLPPETFGIVPDAGPRDSQIVSAQIHEDNTPKVLAASDGPIYDSAKDEASIAFDETDNVQDNGAPGQSNVPPGEGAVEPEHEHAVQELDKAISGQMNNEPEQADVEPGQADAEPGHKTSKDQDQDATEWEENDIYQKQADATQPQEEGTKAEEEIELDIMNDLYYI